MLTVGHVNRQNQQVSTQLLPAVCKNAHFWLRTWLIILLITKPKMAVCTGRRH